MKLAAIWTALACVMPAVQATRALSGLNRHVQRVRSSPFTKAVMLQHNTTRKSLLHQPRLPADFFTHEAEKIEELPKYKDALSKGCHPKCMWNCGGGCDEVCTPVCAPPKCEVTCPQLTVSMCQQKCAPPKCAVVCPTNACERDDCPKCKTVCGPPDCHAHCADNCLSQCAEPQCSWTCKPSDACVQPDCKLDCNHPKVCNLKANQFEGQPKVYNNINNLPDQRILPWLDGHGKDTMSQGLASLDPTTLVTPAPVGVANTSSSNKHGPDHVQNDPVKLF